MLNMNSSSELSCKNNIRRKWCIPGAMFGPFSFINVCSGKDVVMDAENGIKNMVEVAVIFRILQLLYKECASSNHKISIALLSTFPAQVQCMQQKLKNHYPNNEFFSVKVGYVHDYQVGEVDVVIISTVGPNEDECLELKTDDYFNLARHCLWILGDEKVHLKGRSIWKSLILDAKDRQCFFRADEHKDLVKVIVEVKKDLHQLDELLSGETTLFKNTTWKVLFSGMFRSSFSNIESWETKKLVLLMLLKLSSGWRPKGSSTAVSVSESPYSELIKEFKVKGLHIICTVDIMKETYYTQVLKVWDILPFHEISELVKRLDRIIAMYTREYIDHCKIRCVQRGSVFPMKWPATSKIIQYKTNKNRCEEMFTDGANGEGCVENEKVRESLILMKFYPLSKGAVNNMITGCNGGDLGLEFELTEQEKDVVSFEKSSFILGRSGTGKTTVLTMKLFQNEQIHHLACEGFHEVAERNEEAKQDALHQIFVTFSPKLCYAVKQHFGEWKSLTCGGSTSNESSSVSIDDIHKMMLSEDIPDHFIHLPRDAYPLIITFPRFLLMLDATVGISYFERFPSVRQILSGNQTSSSRLVILEQCMRVKDVTYDRFCSSYWPHFNNKLTKNLDPSSVYTEIMSVIKGGLTSGEAYNGILSRDDYVSLCDGRISIFDAQKREIVYAIFLQYEKKKVEYGNFDLADLVNDLHQRLEIEGYKGDVMDYVYIDEVQDLSMRQIMLFKYVCSNVHEGFAFSGDTAQAIAKGIAFRFEDIRCLFFSEFLSGSEKGKMSKIFQLSENFRTHAGVLNLAQSVINLLCHFFPLFVDALSPETSRISGELPILLETDINNNAIKFIFESKEKSSQQITGFGAEQVVLVRNESLKEKVIDIIGKKALVLTIMESKGLEFQDVLLYDFFTTSSFSNEWRIVYEYMKEKDLLNSPSTALSCFDMEKHAVLCSELKLLYVAITRTRQRLWISESTGFSEPIYDYWKKLSLVEVKHLSDSFADKMKIPSSKEEWRSRGIKLFYENNFRMAQLSFLKAGDKCSERLAEAYHLRAMADDARVSQFEKKKLFKDAAKIFLSIGKKELAAECFYEIEDYKTAGDIYLGESMLEKAGNCFHLAKSYELAVEVYEKAGAFVKCLSACADGKLFERGFELIGRWGGCGGAELKFFHEGALYYFGDKDFENMMKFVRSFHYKDMMRSFLTKRRCLDELILLEKEWGNFELAAHAARLKQDPLLEAELLHMGGLHKESSLIILWHVFLNSPIFENAEKPFTQKDGLLRKAMLVSKRESNAFNSFVCKEVQILSQGKTYEELLKKGLEFIYCYNKNALAVSLERVKKKHEIEKIEKDVIDMIHSFLKSANRLDELLLLQETRGKFIEASQIGKEDDHSIDVTLRRLWYVFFGSLWADGKRAWPLKGFKQKGKLLGDAYVYVNDHPDSHDSVLVRTEISILSGEQINLSQMSRYLKETPPERSLRIHFLISRNIMDVHLLSHCSVYLSMGTDTHVEDRITKQLEGRLLKNLVSVDGLIYFYSCWKELIWELINWSYSRGQGGEFYEDFIFNYFGVRKYDVDKYVVLNTEAQWVKQMNTSMINNGYLYIIDARELSSVSSRYWCSELLYVAEKVLRKLQSLYAYSNEKNLSIHQQTEILSSLFQVTKSLQNYKFPYSFSRVSRIVDQYLHLCVDPFLRYFFNIDCKIAQAKEMIYLRGNETVLNMLEEAISINSKSKKALTCGQLGRISLIYLGSKLTRFSDDTKKKVRVCSSPNWIELFDNLNGDRSSSRNGKLAICIHNVLQEMFSADWRAVDECMSPVSFLYLMERLLILSFCFGGYVFTTRSSCVEWLTYEEWGMSLNEGSVTSLDAMKNIHRSLASMVCEMLMSPDDLMQWLTRSNEVESSYPILVFRLIILLSLVCANSEHYYDHLSRLLGDTSLSLLPSIFRNALLKGIKEDCLLDAVAVACEKMDNPLVIVSFTKDFSKSPCQKTIFLNMSEPDFCQEMAIEMLYPEKCEDAATRSPDHGAQDYEFPPLSN